MNCVTKTGRTNDDFAPGMEYIGRWNYKVNPFGTVPFAKCQRSVKMHHSWSIQNAPFRPPLASAPNL